MIYNQFRAVLILLCLTWAIVGPAPVAAAESTAANDLKIVLVPYGWLTGFSGTFGARGHETNVTNSFAQLDKYLNFAAMGHMEVIYRDTVGLIGEFNYARLGDQTSRKGVSLDGQMSFTMSDLAAFYRLGSYSLGEQGSTVSYDLLAGARIWTLDMKLSAEYMQMDDSVHMQKTWVDPIIGARTNIHFNDTWSAELRGGVGGFGANSTFTWDAMALIGYSFCENATLLAGYRAVGLNYESGSGRDNFKANATLHGPIVGLSFTF
jgi:hypothetical protein